MGKILTWTKLMDEGLKQKLSFVMIEMVLDGYLADLISLVAIERLIMFERTAIIFNEKNVKTFQNTARIYDF